MNATIRDFYERVEKIRTNISNQKMGVGCSINSLTTSIKSKKTKEKRPRFWMKRYY